jgi:hypothetical protein
MKPNQQFSFGVGRDNMKKIYVDDIQKKGDKALPGPGKYEYEKSFGLKGLNYSMAAKLPTEKQMLDKSRKLPGPGNYEAINVTGNTQNNSEYRNPNKFAFSKAKDRFVAPTK